MTPSKRFRWLPWLVAYVLIVAALVGGMVYARSAVIESFGSAEAQEQWQIYKADASKLGRKVKSDEPPALVLARDNFGSIVVTTVAISSFLFAFLAFTIQGALQGSDK